MISNKKATKFGSLFLLSYERRNELFNFEGYLVKIIDCNNGP